MHDFLDICLQAVRAGGQILTDMRGQVTAIEKAPKDLVTEADFKSQHVIRELLLSTYPDHDFIGEEQTDAATTESTSAYAWIVDPLDGTLNYVHQLPGYAVSVALRHHGELLVGAVYDPVLDECFSARCGGGSWLNGEPITTSRCEAVEQAMVAASLPAEVHDDSVDLAQFVAAVQNCQTVRRLGSAALNLCYLAAGRLDGYWATCVKNWDVAAGALIAGQAGVVISNLEGKPFDLDDPKFVAAATSKLHRQLRQLLCDATERH